MAYRVEITGAALVDTEEYVEFIRTAKQGLEASERWFRGLVSFIYSLEELPKRFPVIPEQAEFPFELRHSIYFSHRVIFRVSEAERTVSILRVYHGSRRNLQQGDIPV